MQVLLTGKLGFYGDSSVVLEFDQPERWRIWGAGRSLENLLGKALEKNELQEYGEYVFRAFNFDRGQDGDRLRS